MRFVRACRSRLTYANVVASLALFAALGGVSYAAFTLPPRSVGSVQLRDGAVSKRILSRALRAALSGRGVAGPRGPAGPAGPRGPSGYAAGLDVGGDLAGSLPDPTLRASAVTSGAILDDTVTGHDVLESSLGAVPKAVDAQTVSGLGAADLVQGGGALWRGHTNVLEWIRAEEGEKRAFLLSDITPGPNDGLLVGIYCLNNTDEGTGADVVLANYGPGAIDALVDTGDGHPRLARADDGFGVFSNKLVSEHFFNETRRVVLQGVRDNGQAFFVSVIVQHQDDSCRGAVIGHETP